MSKLSSNKNVFNKCKRPYNEEALAKRGFDDLKEYSIDSKLIGKIKKEDPKISPILVLLIVIQ